MSHKIQICSKCKIEVSYQNHKQKKDNYLCRECRKKIQKEYEKKKIEIKERG